MSEWIISSSVLVLLVIVLRFALRGKISLRLQYALWLVVLVRLLMPVSLADSSFSVAGLLQMNRGHELSDIYLWFGESSATSGGENTYLPDSEDDGVQTGQPGEGQNGVQNDQTGGEHSGNQPGNADTSIAPGTDLAPGKDSAADEEPNYPAIGGVSIAPSTEKLENSGKEHISLSRILTVIWCAGMAVTSVILLVSNLRFWSKVRKTRWIYEKKTDLLPIYESDVIETPCLFGLIHPAIYVTEEVIKDPNVMHHVVAHEMTHHAHRDHIWAALRCLCLVLHWYNPLVWWAAALSRRDAELACDEGTIERIGEAVRAEYGRTLIGLTCQGRGFLLSTATTMTGSAKGIKERIMLIANRPKMAKYTVMILIVLVVGLIGCTYCGVKDSTSGADQNEESSEGVNEPSSEVPGEEVTSEEDSSAGEFSEEMPTEDVSEEPTEEPTEESTAPEGVMTPDGLVVPTGYEIKTDILLDMFTRFISYGTTKDEVIETVGLPHGWLGTGNSCGNVYNTADGEMVSVYYTIKYGVYVVDRVIWMYEHVDGYGEALVQSTNPHGFVIPSDFEIKTEITLDMFRQFEARKTTENEIHETVGMPHASVGFGLIADVYFTSDGYMLAVYCATVDGARVLDEIEIMNEDGSREALQKISIEPGNLHTEETVTAGDGIVQIFEDGKTVLADLDGDGESEKITVQLYPDGEYNANFAVQIEDVYCSADAFKRIIGYTEGLDVGKIYLIDLDTSDQWLEIAFYSAGPSMDPVTTFLRYHDGEIVRVGAVPVRPPVLEPDDYSRMEVAGDGTVSGRTRYDVVQTQFVTMCWELKNASEFRATLEEKVPEYYSFELRSDLDSQMYLKQDTAFFKEMNADPGNLITLPKDTVVDIARYYPESGWIQVIYEQGTKAVWLLLDGNEMLQPLNVHKWNLGEYVVGLAAAG